MLLIAALAAVSSTTAIPAPPAASIVILGDISVEDMPFGASEPNGVTVEATRNNARAVIDSSRISRRRFVIIAPSNETYRMKLNDGTGTLLPINKSFSAAVVAGQKWIEGPTLATQYIGGTNATALPLDDQIEARTENLTQLADGMEGEGLESTVLEIAELQQATEGKPALKAKLDAKLAELNTNSKFKEYYESDACKELMANMRLAAGSSALATEDVTRLGSIVQDSDQQFRLRMVAMKRLGPSLTDDSPVTAFAKNQLAAGSDFAYAAADALAKSNSQGLHDFLIQQMKVSDTEKAIPAIYAATKADLPGAKETFFNRLDNPFNPQKTQLIAVLSDLPGAPYKSKLTSYAASNDISISKAAKSGLIGRKDLTDLEKSPYRLDIFKGYVPIDLTQPNSIGAVDGGVKDFLDKLKKERFKGWKAGGGLPPG